MPWSKPDPFGVEHYHPTTRELVVDAVNAFSWLFWPRKSVFTCGELADLICQYYDVTDGDPRMRACYEALREFNSAMVRLH